MNQRVGVSCSPDSCCLSRLYDARHRSAAEPCCACTADCSKLMHEQTDSLHPPVSGAAGRRWPSSVHELITRQRDNACESEKQQSAGGNGAARLICSCCLLLASLNGAAHRLRSQWSQPIGCDEWVRLEQRILVCTCVRFRMSDAPLVTFGTDIVASACRMPSASALRIRSATDTLVHIDSSTLSHQLLDCVMHLRPASRAELEVAQLQLSGECIDFLRAHTATRVLQIRLGADEHDANLQLASHALHVGCGAMAQPLQRVGRAEEGSRQGVMRRQRLVRRMLRDRCALAARAIVCDRRVYAKDVLIVASDGAE